MFKGSCKFSQCFWLWGIETQVKRALLPGMEGPSALVCSACLWAMTCPGRMTAASHEKPRRAFPCATDGAICLAMQSHVVPGAWGPHDHRGTVSRDAWYRANPLWFPSSFPRLLDVSKVTGPLNLWMAYDRAPSYLLYGLINHPPPARPTTSAFF